MGGLVSDIVVEIVGAFSADGCSAFGTSAPSALGGSILVAFAAWSHSC